MTNAVLRNCSCDYFTQPGDILFQIRLASMREADRIRLSEQPAHTNMTGEYRLHGWCGTTNDVATYAEGLVEVVRIAKNGNVTVRELQGAKLAEALNSMGYTCLLDE